MWKEVWRKNGYINVEKPFQPSISVEDNIYFPQTAEAGSKVDCGYINITALDNVKIKVEVVINDGVVAQVDGQDFSLERDMTKRQTMTFPIIFEAPKTTGTIKVSVVVYQWV